MTGNYIGFTKSDFSLLMGLYQQQPWLAKREEALYSLLQLCPEKESFSLIASLLHHFRMFSAEDFMNAVDKMVAHLVETIGVTPTNSLLVASAIDDRPDGSQLVLPALRVPLANRGFDKKFQLVSKYGKGLAKLESDMMFIVIDDFTGTGKTVRARKKSFDEKCKTSGITARFHACSVAAMTAAVSGLNDDNISFWAATMHEKGIPQVYSPNDQPGAYARMHQLEALIRDETNPEVYPFGYGQAEAIVSLGEGSNTPNSVYPIFWTPTYADGRGRKTILCRE